MPSIQTGPRSEKIQPSPRSNRIQSDKIDEAESHIIHSERYTNRFYIEIQILKSESLIISLYVNGKISSSPKKKSIPSVLRALIEKKCDFFRVAALNSMASSSCIGLHPCNLRPIPLTSPCPCSQTRAFLRPSKALKLRFTGTGSRTQALIFRDRPRLSVSAAGGVSTAASGDSPDRLNQVESNGVI